jgi:hypothetical protein
MIEDVRFWLAEPDSNYGWILVSRSTNGPSAKRFDSREHEIPAFQPTLTIQYSEITSVTDEPSSPLHFSLSQNFPNPFNPSTEIRYQLARNSGPAHVKLSILNLLGQSVRRLVDEWQSSGTYSVTWNGKNDAGATLPGGTYFYRLQSGNFQTIRKMTLIK